MPDTPVDLGPRLLQLLTQEPGLKASEIAEKLGVTRRQVNHALYPYIGTELYCNDKYRWFPQGLADMLPTEGSAEFTNTLLSRLSRYYLSCIGHDDDNGVMAIIKSHANSPYVELEKLPGERASLIQSEDCNRLAKHVFTEKNRLTLHLGYPVLVSQKSKKDGEPYVVKPVLLLPLNVDHKGAVTFADTVPIVNLAALKQITNTFGTEAMDELVKLEEELGLSAEMEIPELDELALKLSKVKPEWAWQNACDPDNLNSSGTLAKITKEGLYNTAILVASERSPYTVGLESELKALALLPEDTYAHTALGKWLKGGLEPVTLDFGQNSEPLIEILAMNSEQRQAVAQALTRQTTVITGPPGTGKSQVVTNLLANAAWRDQRVLFASKNNKAVDVVEERINNIGPRPVLLRLGSSQYQTRLAEYLISLLGTSVSADDEALFATLQSEETQLKKKLDTIAYSQHDFITRQNTLAKSERDIAPIREQLTSETLAVLRNADSDDLDLLTDSVHNLEFAINNATKHNQPILARLAWFLLESPRMQALAEALDETSAYFSALHIDAATDKYPLRPRSLPYIAKSVPALLDKIALARTLLTYFDNQKTVDGYDSLESLALEHARVTAKLADTAVKQWNAWLKLGPSRLTPKDRQTLQKYLSLLKMVLDTGPEGTLSGQIRQQYQTLLSEISDMLPCWAVTSLSAKGKVPFEAGFFDLVIFDEGSQCDIASALPLLYRAKRVAVIGDPKQLTHVSSLPKWQDQKLMERYSLLDYSEWGYSYNSLFDLAAGRAVRESIVELKDHHRSHSDIIGFSNRFFYEQRLRVATRHDSLNAPKNEPNVKWVHVPGIVTKPKSGSAENELEAKELVKVLKKLMSSGYSGTIGVVTPFRAQAVLIRRLISREAGLTDLLSGHNFLTDTVHKFQGDERDIMLFSPVVSDGITENAVSFLRKEGNLFNVAITRARAALWVVGNINYAISCDIDYLRKFAEYTQKLKTPDLVPRASINLGPVYPNVNSDPEPSLFEKRMYEVLYAEGIRGTPKLPIEKYVVGLAIKSGDSLLAVEVESGADGLDWDLDMVRRDQLRTQRLYELGWDVIRFWPSELQADFDSCVKKVVAWVSSKAIPDSAM